MFSTTLISSSDNLTRKHLSYPNLCHHQIHLQAKTEGKSSAVELRKNPYTSHLQPVVVEKDTPSAQ